MRRSLRLRQKTKTEAVPLDLQIEILNRLPVKSAGRFLLVSKSWAKIIRSEGFIRSFPHRSLRQPCCLLIAFYELDSQRGHYNWYFFSSSSSSTSTSTSTSFLSRVKCPFSNPTVNDYSYVNGLMSIGYRRGYGRGQTICNPCTGKSINLPIVKTTNSWLVRSFFGYDPVDNKYKVLCMKLSPRWADPWSEFKVFTLGAKPKSWRLIDCSIPHSPWSSNGLCMDGVVYYIAHTGTGMTQLSLMRFDVKSEKFDIFVRISDNFNFANARSVPLLMNYHGKVAVHTKTSENANDLWVFEAGKQAFLEISISELDRSLEMKGINQTGEIIFAPNFSNEANVTLYDRKGASFNNMEIKVGANGKYFTQKNFNYFLDYVESLMLL